MGKPNSNTRKGKIRPPETPAEFELLFTTMAEDAIRAGATGRDGPHSRKIAREIAQGIYWMGNRKVPKHGGYSRSLYRKMQVHDYIQKHWRDFLRCEAIIRPVVPLNAAKGVEWPSMNLELFLCNIAEDPTLLKDRRFKEGFCRLLQINLDFCLDFLKWYRGELMVEPTQRKWFFDHYAPMSTKMIQADIKVRYNKAVSETSIRTEKCSLKKIMACSPVL